MTIHPFKTTNIFQARALWERSDGVGLSADKIAAARRNRGEMFPTKLSSIRW